MAREASRPSLALALVDVAEEMVAEDGPQAFSLAQAARRLGVSISAPYRHYADREELLAAVAARGYRRLAEDMRDAVGAVPEPGERVYAAVEGYLRFAAVRRPLFLTMFAGGLRKARHPALGEAAAGANAVFVEAVRAGSAPDVDDLALTVSVLAHGYASLVADGYFGDPDTALDRALPAARRSVRLVLEGPGPAGQRDGGS